MDVQEDAVAEKSFHSRLLQIDGDLHNDDIRAMKFLCKDNLPKSKLEKITSGHELFLSMETTQMMTAENHWVLVEVFKTIGRMDLIGLLDIDETDIKAFTLSGKISKYRHLLYEIAQDMTTEDTKKMSFLVEKISKSKREKLVCAMDLLGLLEESKFLSPGHLEKLVEYLSSLNRFDLVERIHSFQRGSAAAEEMLPHPLCGGKQHIKEPKEEAGTKNTTQRTTNGLPESIRLELSKELSKFTDDQLTSFWMNLGYPADGLQRLHTQLHSINRGEKIFKMLESAPMLHQDMQASVMKLISVTRLADMLPLSRQIVATFKDKIPDLPREFIRDVEVQHGCGDVRNLHVSTGEASIIAVGSTNQCSGTTFALEQDRDQSILPHYKMDANPRGVCVILNNQHFWTDDKPDAEQLRDRIGSQIDAEKLKVTFGRLHFVVKVFEDRCASEIPCLLDTVRREMVTAEHDCFVCCVLTHGKNDQIYGSDGHLLDIMDLMAPFKATRCPNLAGKPKLFFMQACQGKLKQEGMEVESDTHMEEDGPLQEVVPNEADFLLGYATAPGYVSYRSKSQGSWYISVLTELLDKLGNHHDILSILTKVNQEVGKKQDDRDGRRYKQSPAPQYTLRKKVIFKVITSC